MGEAAIVGVIIVLLVFIVLGIFIVVGLGSVLVENIVLKHIHVLQKKTLVQFYKIKDLDWDSNTTCAHCTITNTNNGNGITITNNNGSNSDICDVMGVMDDGVALLPMGPSGTITGSSGSMGGRYSRDIESNTTIYNHNYNHNNDHNNHSGSMIRTTDGYPNPNHNHNSNHTPSAPPLSASAPCGIYHNQCDQQQLQPQQHTNMNMNMDMDPDIIEQDDHLVYLTHAQELELQSHGLL